MSGHMYLLDNDIDAMLNGSGDEDYDDDIDLRLLIPDFDQNPGTSTQAPEDDSSSVDSSEDDEEDNIPLSNLRWKKKKFISKEIPTESHMEPTRVKMPAEYFENYFTAEIMDQFALATNQYYMTKNGGNVLKPICTAGEIKTFFGIHGLMGCFKYPRMKIFWNQRYKFDPIANAMPRNRFFLLRTNLHIVDVHQVDEKVEQERNRLWRVQPLIEAVRGRCLQLPRNSTHYSIDEQMIPWGGRCPGIKVVVKNKPRPEGLKNFAVTSATGMLLDFEIYQGPTTNLPDIENFGVGPAVILRLASSLPEGAFLYFDRYFTTLPLLQELVKRGKNGTGTLMANRFNTKKSVKYDFKKDTSMKRGEYEAIVSADDKLCILKWKDKKGVLIASSAFGSEPVSMISRWEKKKKEYITVPCPAVVKNYNSFMGGVDVCDQMMEAYRTWIKTRKWTLKVILHLFDLSIVNSWMEYRQDCRANNLPPKDILDLMEFRISLSEYLLAGTPRPACQQQEPEFAPMPHTSNYRAKPLPSPDKQGDGYNHWPTFDTLGAPRSCRATNCKSRSRCRCTKCDVYLCLTKDRNCFYDFHHEFN